MIYFYTGQKDLVHKEIEALRKKFPNHKKLYFSEENFSEEFFSSHFFKNSLFDEYFFVEIEDLLTSYESFFQEHKSLFEEKSVFVFNETKDAGFLKEFPFQEKKNFIQKKDDFDFSFWKAVANRDKKEVWLAFTKDKKKKSVEQIHAGLFSQVRNMYKAKKSQGEGFAEMGFEKESGFRAAKQAAEKYTEEELSVLMYTLIKIKEDSRSEEGGSLESLLEKTILEHI
jgi:hypothetical protein